MPANLRHQQRLRRLRLPPFGQPTGAMTCSGRSTPVASEIAAPMSTQTHQTAGTAPYPQSASRTQRFTSPKAERIPDKCGGATASDSPATVTAGPIDKDRDNVTEHTNPSAPQLDNDAAADGTTHTAEELVQGSSNYTAPQSLARRSWRYRLGRWLMGSAESPEEDFIRNVRIAYKVGDEDEQVYELLVPIDTQCPGDWISAPLLREKWGVDYSNKPRTHVGTTVDGFAVYSFGQIELRWSCRNTKPGWSHGKPSFEPKYYRAQFEVIDADHFEAIIGQPSIRKHKLLKLDNRLVGYFSSHRPAIPAATNVAEVQRRADVRRAHAESRREQAETQIQTQANTNATANNSTNTSAK